MAIMHCQAKAISRSQGRSATAAAAYRAAEKITDERTGEIHDYGKKTGVVGQRIMLPDNAKIDRSTLWNLAEQSEARKDAKVAREWELALPAELNAKERGALALAFGAYLVKRYGVAADITLHGPNAKGDQRNHHAHILTTTRAYDAKTGTLGEKTRSLDCPRTSGQEVAQARQFWAALCNEMLKQTGKEARIDCRTLEAQGIDRPATSHLGPAVTAMERRGIETIHAQRNKAIAQTMQTLDRTRAEPADELDRTPSSLSPRPPEIPQKAPEMGQISAQVEPPTPPPPAKKRSRSDDRER